MRGKKEGYVPRYLLHRASGRAYVNLGGRPVYLGVHGSPQSRALYDRKIAEWLAAGRGFVAKAASDLSVAELLAAYESFAATYYVKRGRQTSQMDRVRRTAGACVRLYGACRACDFGTAALKAVRAHLVSGGLCRHYVNQLVGCLVRAWKWGVEEQLVGASVWHALQAVTPLQQGRTAAPDRPDVGPAPEASVCAVLGVISPVLADVVRFQLWTGARPGEALALRGRDLDRTADVWLYRPASHKNEHRHKGRVIFVGAACQAMLVPYLERLGEGHLFSPRDCVEQIRRQKRRRRKTPVQPSQKDRSKPKPERAPGETYGETSYACAVKRACERAGAPHFSPNQLRHNAAGRFVEEHGWLVAAILLGHSSLQTTKVYAADDLGKAIAAVRQSG
jgi:integrase